MYFTLLIIILILLLLLFDIVVLNVLSSLWLTTAAESRPDMETKQYNTVIFT